MEKILELKMIPWGYEICFNNDCQLREKCLHYQAGLLMPSDRLSGPAVYPAAWKDGQCQRFREYKLARKAWGFNKLYRNLPRHLKTEARECVMSYFSGGCGPYYRYHHGENKLSPSQQEDIMNIMSKFCSTEGLSFDRYEWDYDFT